MPLMRKLGMSAVCAILLSQTATFAAFGRDEDRPSIQALLRELNTQDWNRKNEIERLLQERKGEAADALINALDNPDPLVQNNAAEILDRMSANWDFVISDSGLATILGIIKATREEKVQMHLVSVLGHIGPRSEKIQDTLIDIATHSKIASVRSACASGLSSLIREERAKTAEPAVKTLTAMLQDDISPHVRSAAAGALSQSNSMPELVVPVLIKAVDDNYRQVRSSAAQAIGHYGARAKAAIPKLLELLDTEADTSMRQTCIYALQSIGRGEPQVVKALVDCLDDPQIGSYALNYVSSFGADAAPAVPKLLSIVESDKSMSTRINAARALAQIGPAAKSAVPALEKLNQSSEDNNIKTYIQDAIRRISSADTGGSQ